MRWTERSCDTEWQVETDDDWLLEAWKGSYDFEWIVFADDGEEIGFGIAPSMDEAKHAAENAYYKAARAGKGEQG